MLLGPVCHAAQTSEEKDQILAAIPVLNKGVDFETDVLPIFKRNCLACHSQTDAEADLVLETPQTILKGSEDGPVVVPHNFAKSALLKSAAQLSKPLMPPKNNKVGAEPLKPDELSLLKTWIEQGATGTVNAKPKPLQWKPLPAGLHPILAVAVTTDGEFAACGRANQIFLYHVPTGQIVTRLIDPKLNEKPNRSGYKSSAQRDFVQSLAFSPDGHMLASGEYRMVKLWQRQPEAPQFVLGNEPAITLAVSPDGRWIATAGKDNVIHIWDASNGKPAKELTGHTAAVNALKFSPDSAKLLSGSADKTLRLWDVAAGKQLAQADTPSEISAVEWVLGGKQVASTGDNVIRLWNLPDKPDAPLAAFKEMAGHTQLVTCLGASSDGKQLASGSRDGSVRWWSVESAKQVKQMDHGAPVLGVAVSPNGKLIASVGGKSAKLWTTDRGQMTFELKGDPSLRLKEAQAARALEFAKNETTYWKSESESVTKAQAAKADALKKATEALAVADKALAEKKEALDKATDPKAKTTAEADQKKANTAKTNADKALREARLAAKQAEQTVADAKAGSERTAALQKKAEADIAQAKKEIGESEKPMRAVTFSADNLSVATAGDDGVVRTWGTDTGLGFQSYATQAGPAQSVTLLADARLFCNPSDKPAQAWSTLPNWKLVRAIGTGDEKSPLVNRVLALDFSGDGQLLATGGGVPSRNGEVKIWRVGDGSLVREIKPSHSDTVFGLAFSPDGKALATASADKFVKVFEVGSGKLLKQLAGHTHYALSVGWRADGRALVSSGADKTIKLWSYPTGEQTKSIEDFKKEVTSARYVGLSNQILSASGEARMRLLGEDGKNVKDYGGSKGFIFSTAVTPDGQTVLGGGQDSVLRVWNGSTGKSLFNLEPPEPELPQKSSAKTVKK